MVGGYSYTNRETDVNEKTESVDVLAVLDECIAAQSEACASWAHADLPAARTAITELIEAAKHARVALYHATESARSQRTKTGNKHALSRIEAALRGMGAL